MPLTITATDAGFRFFDAVGGEVAPDAFVASRLNPTGSLFQTRNGATWLTEESFFNPSVSVEVSLARDAALPPGARAGDETELALSGLTFTRTTNGVSEVIGGLTFDGIMTVDAVFHPNGSRIVGNGSRPNWIVELGSDVIAAARDTGYAFEGSATRDIFSGSAANQPLSAAGFINGFGGNDDLTGGTGGAEIRGGQGDDLISARGGANAAWGGAGADTIDFADLTAAQSAFGGRGHDTVFGGSGNDIIQGGAGRDRLRGADGADTIKGGRGADRLIGDNGDDSLNGNAGRDLLKGGRGDDTLTGGAGNDKLNGGAGQDVFVFSSGSGRDRITDFEIGQDQLSFRIPGLTFDDFIIEDGQRGAVIRVEDLNLSVLLLGVEAADLGATDFIL